MKKIVNNYEHDFCDKCEFDIDTHRERGFLYNGTLMCNKCWNNLIMQKPYFISSIPTFVDGGIYNIFDFEDEEDLYKKLIKNNYINDNEFLTKDDNKIVVVQNSKKSYWWVIGYIKNYNLSLLNIPDSDFDIYYTTSNTVNDKKLRKMLKDKLVITKNYKPVIRF